MQVAQTTAKAPGSPTTLITGDKKSEMIAMAPASCRIFTRIEIGIRILKRSADVLTEYENVSLSFLINKLNPSADLRSVLSACSMFQKSYT